MEKLFVSLGAACAAAWQIRRFTGDQRAYPFDWTILPFRSLTALLKSDFDGFLADDAFALTANGLSVVNVSYPMLHLHDFHLDAPGSDQWRTQIPEVRSRFEHLIKRWRATMNGGASLVLIRQQGHFETDHFTGTDPLTSAEADAFCTQLETDYPNADFRVVFIDALDGVPAHPRAHTATIGFDTGSEWPDPGDRWRGPTKRWQQLLQDHASRF